MREASSSGESDVGDPRFRQPLMAAEAACKDVEARHSNARNEENGTDGARHISGGDSSVAGGGGDSPGGKTGADTDIYVPLILVHAGDSPIQFPSFLADTVRQAVRWNPHMHVHVVASHAYLESDKGAGIRDLVRTSTFSENDAYWSEHVTLTEIEGLPADARLSTFRNVTASHLDGEWRGGFWRFASERLFILHAAMVHLGLDEAFHMENDNIIFATLSRLLPALRRLYGGMAATALAGDTTTAGFLYVHRRAALAELLDFMLGDGATMGNEMNMLSSFSSRLPAVLGKLPVAPAGASFLGSGDGRIPRVVGDEGAFDALGGFFDNAAHGQWLGGAHDIHTNGIVVPHHVNAIALFSPMKLKYKWRIDEKAQLRRAYISVFRDDVDDATAPEWHPVFTLHIHSKEIARFAS